MTKSTSEYVLNHAVCTVLVVKSTCFPPAMHDGKEEVVKVEEEEVGTAV